MHYYCVMHKCSSSFILFLANRKCLWISSFLLLYTTWARLGWPLLSHFNVCFYNSLFFSLLTFGSFAFFCYVVSCILGCRISLSYWRKEKEESHCSFFGISSEWISLVSSLSLCHLLSFLFYLAHCNGLLNMVAHSYPKESLLCQN